MVRLRASATAAALRASVVYGSLAIAVTVAWPGEPSVSQGFVATSASQPRAAKLPQAALGAVSLERPVVSGVEFMLDWRFAFSEIVLLADSAIAGWAAVPFDVQVITDQVLLSPGKSPSDSLGPVDSSIVGFGKGLADSPAIVDGSPVFSLGTSLADAQALSDQLQALVLFSLTLGDSESLSDGMVIAFSTSFAETQASTDSASFSTAKPVAETQSETDSVGFGADKRIGMFEPRTPLNGEILNELAMNVSLDDTLVWTIDGPLVFNVTHVLSDLAGVGDDITIGVVTSQPINANQLDEKVVD